MMIQIIIGVVGVAFVGWQIIVNAEKYAGLQQQRHKELLAVCRKKK